MTGVRGSPPVPDREPPRRAAAVDVAVVLGTLALAGLVGGVVWALVADPAAYVRIGGRASMPESQLAERFNPDGWYAVVAGVGGVVTGALLIWWRSRNVLLTTLLLGVGAALAAAVMAGTGYLLGPGDPAAALARARPMQQVPVRLAVTAASSYLVWPIGVLLGALLVLWSTDPSEHSGSG